jgi:hypothetical protein
VYGPIMQIGQGGTSHDWKCRGRAGSAHKMNKDIEGLSDRIKTAVPEALRYSSLYWAAHLANSATGVNERTELYNLLKLFFHGGRPLFWLEVVSLIGEVKVAITSLLLVVAWIDVSFSFRKH